MRLYQSACRLHREGEKSEKIQGDLLSGKVVRLNKNMLLGTITGPAFEAEISTERGEGIVRFLLTRQGLGEPDEDGKEATAAPLLPPRSPKALPN